MNANESIKNPSKTYQKSTKNRSRKPPEASGSLLANFGYLKVLFEGRLGAS